MYQVWPVLPAFAKELLVPYSPVPMEPSTMGVVHWADAGRVAKMSVTMTRKYSREERRMTNLASL